MYFECLCLSGGSVIKESACQGGDAGSTHELGGSSGEVDGNPLQYSCLENSMDREPGELLFIGWQRVGHNLATK